MITAGVDAHLARERALRVSELRYAIRFRIPEEPAIPVSGDLLVTFTLHGTAAPLALDFAPDTTGQVHVCEANGTPLAVSIEHEHVVIPSKALREGPNALRLAFTAGNAPLNRRHEYLYSVFVPARAREAFPCFDQPDLKGRWTLTLEIADHWSCVSNTEGSEHRRFRDADGRERTIVVFAQTEPLPTYLFAFAAGKFSQVSAGRDGHRLRLYFREADSELLARNREAVFDAHGEARRWLEAYTNIPYPFEKLDLVLLPDFQFSGMEHPGAIFYNSSRVLLSPSSTRQQRLARASLIAHETAHMWFGDLVTMTWFDDVWMKEVFANFMAAKIVDPQFAELDHDLRFLHTHYPAAYDVDRTAGANPIRQPLPNLDDAGSLYGAIIYLKSPIVMRQLELLLGETALRDALRTYLARYRFGNASWRDLLDILAARSTFDLEAWSRDWIEAPGRPVVENALAVEDGVIWTLSLRTTDAGGKGTLAWPQRLDVALGYGARVEHVPVWLDGEAEAHEVRGRPAPDYVLPNGRGLGYGEFRLSEASREWLTRHLPEVSDPLTRGAAWLTLWDGMLCGDVPAGALLDLALRCVAHERNEVNLQRILSDVERLFWIFQGPEERNVRAPAVEAVLLGALSRAGAASVKAAIFASVRAIATTPATLDWLQALWAGEARIEGLATEETDEIALAQELAIRRGEAGAEIVRRQLARTQSPDRRDALAFVAPALSSQIAERDRFFATIADARQRRREPWVVDGMRWLHHPLRAEASLHYIEPGLELLEEVKRTSDIFLPKRWLDAMFGGHRSADAARIVRAFVESRPAGYPAALRRMVLASADYLLRAAALSFPSP